MVEFRVEVLRFEGCRKTVSCRNGYEYGRHTLIGMYNRDSLNFEFFIIQFRDSLIQIL